MDGESESASAAAELLRLMSKAGQKNARARARPKQAPRPGYGLSPGSLEALAKHRGETLFGAPGRPRCRRCQAFPVRGGDTCRRHGGASRLRSQGRETERRRVLRSLNRMAAKGLIPEGLMRAPIWAEVQALNGRGCGAALALLAGWLGMEGGDVEAWPAAMGEARAVIDVARSAPVRGNGWARVKAEREAARNAT